MSLRKSQRLASAAAVMTLEISTDEHPARWNSAGSMVSPHCDPLPFATTVPLTDVQLFFRPPQQNRRQPSSADSLHAPRPPAAVHTLKIAQADGFGASLPASTAQQPTPQTPTPATTKDLGPGEESVVSTAKTPKSSWNALHRYYSKASSFPDYEPPQPAMGVERLKRVNHTWGSVNTLTTGSNKREFPESPSVSHQNSTKRQRRDSHLKGSFSPESVFQNSPSSSSLRFKSRSHADNADSTRSPELNTGHAFDIYDPDPAPANITSDITPRAGRGRHQTPKHTSANRYAPAISKQTAKRIKVPIEHDEIVTSEDELQANHSNPPSNVRQTNFSHIRSPLKGRQRMRGDITPTKFGNNALQEPSKPSMAILKAVSGDCTYEATGDSSMVYLRPSSDKPSFLEAWSSGKLDEEHDWISFSVLDVNNIKYGGCYLSFRRSMIRGRPPAILLQFAAPEGAAQVARKLRKDLAENNRREEMKNMFDIAWEKAVQRSRQRDAEIRRERAPTDRNESCHDTPWYPKPLEDNSKKLKDRMTVQSNQSNEERRRSASPLRRVGMETRRTRRSSPPRQETFRTIERWSEKNSSWEENWKQTLVYPATGRNRASVDKEDIIRLDEGEFLNDNLISFYLRYLQTNMERERPELLNRVHIFSTFFFEKLTSRKGSINYDGVKNWTSKIDLFSYDYIVVPVNENAHWYLAVVCNTPKLLEPAEEDDSQSHGATTALEQPRSGTPILATVEREMSDISLEDITVATRRSSRHLSSAVPSSPAKATPSLDFPPTPAGPRSTSKRLDASQPRIVTLDSLGSTHSATCRALKDYLVEEAKDKKNINLTTVPGGMKARGIPEQNNFCDCGVFVLGYMEEFLKDPDSLVRKILLRDKVDWSVDAVRLRKKVRNILFRLQKEQIESLAKEREQRRHQKRRRQSSTGSASDMTRTASPKSPGSRRDGPLTPGLPHKMRPAASPAVSRSATPATVPTRSPCGTIAETSADESTVDIVKRPREVHPTIERTPSEKQAPPAHDKSQRVQRRPDSPPPSSNRDATHINDTQDSVQLISVVSKPQTPQPSQANEI